MTRRRYAGRPVQTLAAEIGAYYELFRATRQGVVPAQ
jgi:hypothetical protein